MQVSGLCWFYSRLIGSYIESGKAGKQVVDKIKSPGSQIVSGVVKPRWLLDVFGRDYSRDKVQ